MQKFIWEVILRSRNGGVGRERAKEDKPIKGASLRLYYWHASPVGNHLRMGGLGVYLFPSSVGRGLPLRY